METAKLSTVDFIGYLFSDYVKQCESEGKDPGFIEIRYENCKYRKFLRLFELSNNPILRGENVYFGVGIRNNDRSGKKKDIKAITALWADIDYGEKGHRKKSSYSTRQEVLDALKLKGIPRPTIIIDSGHGVHLYWKLKEPLFITDNITVIESVLRGISKYLGGDTTHDISRILRVPGSINVKEGCEPVECYVLEWNPQLAYSLPDFEGYAVKINELGLDVDRVIFSEDEYEVDIESLNIDPYYKKLIISGDATKYKGNRSARDMAIVVALRKQGITPDEIRNIWRNTKYKVSEKYYDESVSHGDAYLECTIAKADKYIIEEVNATEPASSILGNIREHNNCYVERKEADSEEATNKPISNFIISPKLYIHTEEGDYIEGEVISNNGNKANIIIPPSVWSSKQSFTKFVDRLRWTQFNGSNNQVQYIKGLICQKKSIPKKKGVVVLGEHDGLFLAGKKVISKDGIVENAPIVYLPRSGEYNNIAEKLDYVHIEEDEYRNLVQIVYSNLISLSTPEVILPNIGWWFSTPFKVRIMALIGEFPILSVFGGAGGGKTTQERIFGEVFGLKKELYSAKEKPFVLLYLTSSTNAIAIIFDEYKPWQIPKDRLDNLHNIIRLSYNGSMEGRGKPDQTMVSYQISAPIVIVGEGSFSEEALLERIIPCSPRKAVLKDDKYSSACNTLNNLSLNRLTDRYIAWTLRQDCNVLWNEAKGILATFLHRPVTSRIKDNLTVMVFGVRAFELFGKEWRIELPNDIGLESAINNCIDLLTGAKDTIQTPLDYFIEKMSIMANSGRIKYGDHYYIHDRKLYFHFGTCYGEFRKYARESNLEGEILNEAEYKRAFRENLEEKGYVESFSDSTNWGEYGYKRAYTINLDKAEMIIDVSGFQCGLQLVERTKQREEERGQSSKWRRL